MLMYISPGNRRMDFPTWSLPSGKTCSNNSKLCHKFCYARKAEKLWKHPKASRERNYKQSQSDTFVTEMVDEISKLKSDYFRIHESGDFYSQEYLSKWFKICRIFPNKKFLVFTQMYDLDWSQKPANMIVYWSIWADTDMSKVPKEGLKAYCIDDGSGKVPQYKVPDVKLCTKGKGSDIKCNDCMHCFDGKGDVKFKLH